MSETAKAGMHLNRCGICGDRVEREEFADHVTAHELRSST